jgi:hypothetical protein
MSEGIFFMDEDFIIQSQYSRVLETILGIRGLEGKKLPEILAAGIHEGESKIFIFTEYLYLLFNRDHIAGGLSQEMSERLNPIREMVYINPETWEERLLTSRFMPVYRGGGRLFVQGGIRDVTVEKWIGRRFEEETKKNREEISRLKALITNEG